MRHTSFVSLVVSLLSFAPAPGLLYAQSAQAPAAQAPAATAGSLAVHLDPARTSITFKAGLFHHIHGSLQLKGGIFGINTQTGIAQGEILVDAATEKSNDASLDKKIHNETLEVEKFPTVIFDPQKVSGTLPAAGGQVHLKVSGVFTIDGHDHPLSLDVLTMRSGPQVEFRTEFAVPYVQWGMKDAGTFLMRNSSVVITVVSHGVLEGTTAGS